MSDFAAKLYEVFEHTTDVGLHASGATLRELFAHVAEGMESLLVPPEQVRAQVRREIRVEGHDAVSLLINWLNELIFLFDTEYLIFRHFEIDDLSEMRLHALSLAAVIAAHLQYVWRCTRYYRRHPSHLLNGPHRADWRVP